ncbi:MAG: HAD-IIB family hydrolase [Coriobacteriia bacterium]|nr:HAD-IIB family hydrolase [Coriobacteriia bacterium]
MYRAIITDIDGTLRDDVEGVPGSAELAFELCRAAGIATVVCTGRNLGSVQDDVMALRPDALITGGGCRVQCGNDLLVSATFSASDARAMHDWAHEADLAFSFETLDCVYTDVRMARACGDDFEAKIAARGLSGRRAQIVAANRLNYEDNMGRLEACGAWGLAHKVTVLGPRADVDEMASRFSAVTQTVQLRDWGDRYFWEALPAGCDKGSAARKLCSALGIAPEQTMGFGDSQNDVDLLRFVGHGFAVRGAPPELLAVADGVCDTPANDGLLKALLGTKVIDATGPKERISA